MRRATCRCGRLSAECQGEPVRVSVCHCLTCQKRSGSAFAAQARFPEAAVTIGGEVRMYREVGDSGGAGEFGFCPHCGATVFYRIDAMPGVVAVAIGAFADPTFPAPRFSVYENRKHGWVDIVGEGIVHD
jgi:hypothetical protein